MLNNVTSVPLGIVNEVHCVDGKRRKYQTSRISHKWVIKNEVTPTPTVQPVVYNSTSFSRVVKWYQRKAFGRATESLHVTPALAL